MKELLVLWVESYGLALKLANSFVLNGGELLDCSVIGKWSQLIVKTENVKSVDVILLEIPTAVACQKKHLKNVDAKVIEAYLSLANEKVQDFILTIENEFVGDAFEIAQKMINENINIVDFRLLRFQEPKTILILTGAQDQLDKSQLIMQNFLAQKNVNMSINVINNLSSQVKNLFNLD
jgi:hypothetical protein